MDGRASAAAGSERPRPAAATVAVDAVLLLGLLAAVFLLLGGSIPLTVLLGVEYAVLWWFMWRIARSSPGTMLLSQVFGWRPGSAASRALSAS